MSGRRWRYILSFLWMLTKRRLGQNDTKARKTLGGYEVCLERQSFTALVGKPRFLIFTMVITVDSEDLTTDTA